MRNPWHWHFAITWCHCWFPHFIRTIPEIFGPKPIIIP